MDPSSINAFPPEVIEKLRAYVYRLIDPRDGETFYVGNADHTVSFEPLSNDVEPTCSYTPRVEEADRGRRLTLLMQIKLHSESRLLVRTG